MPALLLPLLTTWYAVAASGLLRGVGLAILFVVCGTLGAELVPAERRGEGLGLLGIVAGLPAVFGMPLGLWLAERAGYPVVFVAGAAVALAGLAAVAALPSGRTVAAGETSGPAGPSLASALRTGALVRPALLFGSTAMAAGVFVTFLPGALTAGASGLAAPALLLQSVAATASRCWAGRWGDRHGAARLLVPASSWPRPACSAWCGPAARSRCWRAAWCSAPASASRRTRASRCCTTGCPPPATAWPRPCGASRTTAGWVWVRRGSGC
ncbi:MFS transporter [Flindersiella endophytica]